MENGKMCEETNKRKQRVEGGREKRKKGKVRYGLQWLEKSCEEEGKVVGGGSENWRGMARQREEWRRVKLERMQTSS